MTLLIWLAATTSVAGLLISPITGISKPSICFWLVFGVGGAKPVPVERGDKGYATSPISLRMLA